MRSNEARIETCCEHLQEVRDDPATPLDYSPKFRSYRIRYNPPSDALQVIDNCPWCGARLPENLRDRWYDTIEELGYDIDDYHARKIDVPEEFKSEAWWRKRGL